MKQDLSGKWAGKLTYGKNFGYLEHEALFFTMDLEQDGDEFAGNSRDVDGIGIDPCETIVTGFVNEEQINFVKEHRFSILAAQNANGQAGEGKGVEVSFSGIYNPITGEFEGEWIILSGYILYSNLFFERDNGGSWSMRREEA